MLSIDEVVSALRTSRQEFAKLFWQAQVIAGVELTARKDLEALASNEPDEKKAFKLALAHAQQNGFFLQFISLAGNSGLEDGKLARFVLETLGNGNAELQAMSNPPAGFGEPLLFGKGILKSIQFTGKVLINDADKGTGVLIGPNIFLTAWHVVQDMFKLVKDDNGVEQYKEKTENIPTLDVVFNSFLDTQNGALKPAGNAKKVRAHPNKWLICYSLCHISELNGIIPAPPQELNGYDDYAIIRLSTAIGSERRWVTPDARVLLPQPNTDIVILQHPQGVPMKMHYSVVVDPEDSDQDIKPFRFLHSVNAEKGSSGGPCFTKDFLLLGIHQGVWDKKINGRVINRGVPITKIIEHYTSRITRLPTPDPADLPTWCLDKKTYMPVIGSDDFQAELWRSAIAGEKRIVTINGFEKTGKTFMIDVAGAVLNDADHLKVVINEEILSKQDPLLLAQHICSNAGASVPPFVSELDFRSSPAAWINTELIGNTMDALEVQRNNRLVWILIKNLDHVNITDQKTSDFLLALYNQVDLKPWLRIVLDGMQSDIPAGLDNYVHRYRTREITADDIENYYRRGISELNLNVDLTSVKPTAIFLHQRYSASLAGKPKEALPTLAKDSRDFFLIYLKQ